MSIIDDGVLCISCFEISVELEDEICPACEQSSDFLTMADVIGFLKDVKDCVFNEDGSDVSLYADQLFGPHFRH